MKLTTSRMNKEKKKNILLLMVFGMVLGIGLALYDLSTTVLFIDTFTTAELPRAFMISGVIGVALLSLYAYQKNRFSFAVIALISFSIAAAAFLFVYYGIQNLNKIKYTYVSFVIAGPINVLLLYNFRNLYNNLFFQKQTKRLSEWVDLGIYLAFIAVFFAVPHVGTYINVSLPGFILISGISILISLVVLSWSINKIEKLKELTVSAQYINAHNNYFKLRKNKYFKLLIWFSISLAFISLFVDYYFFKTVELRHEDLENFTNFLAHFFGVTITFGIFFKAFIYSPILNKYGLRAALLVLPVIVALFSILSIVIGSYFGSNIESSTFHIFFITIAVTKLLTSALRQNLAIPAFRYYFLPIEFALRDDTHIKVAGVIKEIGGIAAGLALFYIIRFPLIEDVHYAIILSVIGILSAIIVFKIYAAYREVLKATLNKQQIVKADQARQTYAEKLTSEIKTVPKEALPRHLNIINTLDPVVYKKAVLSLIDSDEDRAQEIALKQAGKLCFLEAIPIIERIMDSKYYNVLRNRDLIEKTYDKLRGAEFRLEKLRYIEQLTYSKLVNERVFGASLTRYADEDTKPKLLLKLFRDAVTKVRYYAAAAAAGSSNEKMLKNLVDMLDNPIYSNAAVASISATGVHILPVLESAFHQTGQSEKIQLRIVQIYGRVGGEAAVELLLKKLDLPNQNLVSGALVALSKSGYNVKQEMALSIKRELEDTCGTVVWNMSAFLDLDKSKSSTLLLDALKAEITFNYKTIFQLLALLYEPKSVELVEKNINSGNTDQSDFASELLDIFLEEELKPMLLPVLNVSSYAEKIDKLQYIIPTNQMPKREVLYNLIQKDYKKINRWTKACSIQELSEYKSVDDMDIFAANLVNPDPMLREIAAAAYYKISNEKFDDFMQRDKYKKEYIDQAVKLIEEVTKTEDKNLEESPKLNIEIARFLSETKTLDGVPGLVLAEIARLAKAGFYSLGETIAQYDFTEDMNFAFIFKGSVSIQKNAITIKELGENSFVHNFDYINEGEAEYKLVAAEDSIIFNINAAGFSEICSFYDIVPSTLIDKVSVKPKKKMIMSMTN